MTNWGPTRGREQQACKLTSVAHTDFAPVNIGITSDVQATG